jgi:hypothetical protein
MNWKGCGRIPSRPDLKYSAEVAWGNDEICGIFQWEY